MLPTDMSTVQSAEMRCSGSLSSVCVEAKSSLVAPVLQNSVSCMHASHMLAIVRDVRVATHCSSQSHVHLEHIRLRLRGHLSCRQFLQAIMSRGWTRKGRTEGQ